ncbi:MAG: iron-containing redox enzyme family protein [Rhodospirillaceae bacterium]|nr:iron-containing redox enzyme family protein [Rhodospirillaceae bacterium]
MTLADPVPVDAADAAPDSTADSAADSTADAFVEDTLRGLAIVWTDFETRLDQVPIIDKLHRGAFRLEDYKALLANLRQQVIDGGCWIARAASQIDVAHFDLRSQFLRHSITEHRDFRMLEDNYASVGGDVAAIRSGEKNIGSEALSAFMFHRASRPNPFDLLGAMFIIEGLGSLKASGWAEMIREQLGLAPDQVSFLAYHGANDEDHLAEFADWLHQAADHPNAKGIVKTARVVARLYLLQLEELDHV